MKACTTQYKSSQESIQTPAVGRPYDSLTAVSEREAAKQESRDVDVAWNLRSCDGCPWLFYLLTFAGRIGPKLAGGRSPEDVDFVDCLICHYQETGSTLFHTFHTLHPSPAYFGCKTGSQRL